MSYNVGNLISYPVPISELTEIVRNDASISKQYAIGRKWDGTPVVDGEDGYEDNSLYYKEISKKWAINPEDEPVEGSGVTAKYSSKHWASKSEDSASDSNTEALKSEGYAIGTQNGDPVGSESPYHENNSKYYSEVSKDAADFIGEHATAIDAIGDNIQDVENVAADLTNIDSVASDLTNIDTVAGNKNNIDSVADNLSNINAVNLNKNNIDTVANNSSIINTVATNIQDVNSVATNIQDVNSVASDLTNIDAVNNNKTNIDTVATNITDVNTIATDITNVNNVASDLANINAVAGDLAKIDDAPNQALKSEGFAVGTQNGTPVTSDSPYWHNNSRYFNDNVSTLIASKADKVPSATDGDIVQFDENGNIEDSGVSVSGVTGRISNIEDLIPTEASTSNQLADKAFVNSSIATATATFRGTYNLVTDLSLDPDTATESDIATAIATYLSGHSISADNNDYVFIQFPDSVSTPTIIVKVDKYKYNGSAWGYEYTLNSSGFTAEQWAALNSGITSTLVTSYSNHISDSSIHVTSSDKNTWNAKYDKPSGGIPSTDMTNAVRTSLGLANSAYQKPSGGIPSTDMTTAVQTSLGKADTAVQPADLNDVKAKYASVTIATSDWSNNTCTKTVTGMTSDYIIMASADSSSMTDYIDCGVKCTAQGTNSLTFACNITPSNSVTVIVLCFGAIPLSGS